MAPAIRFDNLSKSYRDGSRSKSALKGISFSVEEGEIFGFLGPNGAGKTTAMHVLMDFIFPTDGKSEIMGIDSREPRARQPVGFLPEIFNFDTFLTGEDFLRLFGKMASRNRELVEAHIPELLRFLDLPDAGKIKIRNYSKGMTQKIGLAQALIGDPSILVLDEPTSGMDPIAKARIKQLFTKLRSEGKTVFLSTHILSDVEDIADRVAIINNGELLTVDRVSNLISGDEQQSRIVFEGEAALLSAIGEKVEVMKHDDRHEVHCPDKITKAFVLETILRHSGEVISVKPVGSSLQSQFLKMLNKEELADD